MTNDSIDIDKLAGLAMLELTDDEKTSILCGLNAIISFADTLSSIEPDSMPPAAHIAGISNAFREDTAENSFTRDELLSNAPLISGGFIRIPRASE